MLVIENLKTNKARLFQQYMIRKYAESDVNNYIRICTFYLIN